jgi:hypothetical protein
MKYILLSFALLLLIGCGRSRREQGSIIFEQAHIVARQVVEGRVVGRPAFDDGEIQIWLSEDLSLIRKFCGEEEIGGRENELVAEINVRGKRAYLTVGNRLQFTDEPFERKRK